MKHPAFRTLILAGILPASTALAAHSEAVANGEAKAKAGLPQMDVSTYPSQVFWLAVCFVVLYVLFAKVSLPRVSETLERRNAQKNGDLAQAADWNDDAERVKAEYERSLTRARSTAATNVAAAERDVSSNIADEQAKFAEGARKRLVTAEQGIAKAKTEALNSLADISADIAAEMVQKIAGVPVNKADAKKAVTTAMQEG